MEFLAELFALPASVGGIRYTVTAGGGYFQNVRRLTLFSEREIVLADRRGAVRVEGRALRIGKYFAGDVLISGTIERVERVGLPRAEDGR